MRALFGIHCTNSTDITYQYHLCMCLGCYLLTIKVIKSLALDTQKQQKKKEETQKCLLPVTHRNTKNKPNASYGLRNEVHIKPYLRQIRQIKYTIAQFGK